MMRRFGVILATFILAYGIAYARNFLTGGVVTAVIPPTGPVAEWMLNSASITGTTVADASGNGNTATVVNGPLTFGAMGANFNGQQYLDSTLAVTSSALTVSVWFNAASLQGTGGGGNPRILANSH